MKKLTMLLLAAALTLCPLFALAAQETISVYNWGDYIEPEVLDLFEQETGIKVIYETFETNEDMYAKIAMGGSSYDVIIPSDYMIERMIQENLLQKINWENIPNVANIDPRFMNEGYDPQSEYAVPYTWGTMGILYNTEMVDEVPTSWNVLMDPAYTMDMLMLNSPRDTLAIALVMTGHDLNSTDPADLEDAKNLLIEQKPMVLAYVVDEVKDKMIAGEAAVAMVWSGDATFCMSENDELDYVVPEEGSNIFYDSICIPANARNVSGAEKFIDFLCRGDTSAMRFRTPLRLTLSARTNTTPPRSITRRRKRWITVRCSSIWATTRSSTIRSGRRSFPSSKAPSRPPRIRGGFAFLPRPEGKRKDAQVSAENGSNACTETAMVVK